MNYNIVLEKLFVHLKKYFKEDIDLDETRLILIFLIQKIQYVKLIIDIIYPNYENKKDVAIKTVILYCLNYEKLLEESTVYKKEFNKKELISEILEYIKKSDVFKEKLDIVETEESQEEDETKRMTFLQKKCFFSNCKSLEDVIKKHEKDKKIHFKLYNNKDKIKINNDELINSIDDINKIWQNCSEEQNNIYNILV